MLEIFRMMWNLFNFLENVDLKMVVWGFVDYNGGKFIIGNIGVSFIVFLLVILEGYIEGIYIVIVD